MGEVLFALLLGGLILMFIGHGMWLVLAWLIRLGKPRQTKTQFDPTLSDDRTATARYLAHLLKKQLIDQDTCDRMFRMIARDVHGSTAPTPQTPPNRPWVDHVLAKAEQKEDTPKPSTDLTQDNQPHVTIQPTPGPTREILTPVTPKPLERKPVVMAQTQTPKPAPKPVEPSRPWSEMIAQFMAEKNIRWGELIGGLLIICCSTALVISLWSKIDAIPMLKFMIFTTVTAALFGAGLFVQHRWKVPTTGRAVLSIATLLVPLNFLAFAAFSPVTGDINAIALIIELATAVLFAALLYFAGRVIMPAAPKIMAGGIVTLSATALAMQYLTPQNPIALWQAASLPAGLYVLVMALMTWRITGKPSPSQDNAPQADGNLSNSLIFMLSLMTFACAAPFGLAIHLAGNARAALQCVSPLLSLLAVPGLMIGYILWQKKSANLTASKRTAAACIWLVGTVIMLLAVALAWPIPIYLLPTLLVNAAAMVILSMICHRITINATWINRAALCWFSLAWVLALQIITGNIAWSSTQADTLIQALLSILSAKALLLPVGVTLAIAEWNNYRKQHHAARSHYLTAALIGLISVALLTWRGFGIQGDSSHITWVYGIYTAMALLMAWRLQSPWPTWCAVVLMQLAVAQTMVYIRPMDSFIWPGALMTGASVCVAGSVLCSLFSRRKRVNSVYTQVYSFAAIILSLGATAWMIGQFNSSLLQPFSIRLFWLASLWLMLALVMRDARLFAGMQVVLLAATATMVHHKLLTGTWQLNPTILWQDPRVWQMHLLVIGGLSLLWLLIRLALGMEQQDRTITTESQTPTRLRSLLQTLRRMLNPHFPPIDQMQACIALIGCIGLSIWAVGMNLLFEHGGSAASRLYYEITQTGMVAGWLTWLLLGIVISIFLIQGIRQSSKTAILCLVFCWFCVTALIAARFQSDHHVLMIWCWLLAVTCSGYAIFTVLGKRINRLEPQMSQVMQTMVYGLFAMPALVLTVSFTFAMSQGTAVLPELFTHLANATTMAGWLLQALLLGPIMLIVASLMILGLSRSNTHYASTAAALMSIMTVWVEWFVFSYWGYTISPGLVFVIMQINAVVSALLALIWHHVQRLQRLPNTKTDYPLWPLYLGRITMCLAMVLAAAAIFLAPDDAPRILRHGGFIYAIFAYAITEWAIWRLSAKRTPTALPINQWTMMTVILLAVSLARFDINQWLCFHILAVGWVVAGCVQLFTLGRYTHKLAESGWAETFDTFTAKYAHHNNRIEHDLTCIECNYNLRGMDSNSTCPECGQPIAHAIEQTLDKLKPQWTAMLNKARTLTTRSIILCIVLGIVFAIRAAWDDPQQPWWSMGILGGVAALSMALGAWAPRRAYAYLGALSCCLGASIGFGILYWNGIDLSLVENIAKLIHVNVIALVFSGLAWLWIEQKYLKNRLSATGCDGLPLLHHTAVMLGTVIMGALTVSELVNRGASFYSSDYVPLTGIIATSWAALAATTLLVLACTYDSIRKHVPSLLHVLGLTAMLEVLNQCPIPLHMLAMMLCLVLAAYACITNLAMRLWDRFKPASNFLQSNVFIPYANFMLTLLAMAFAFGVSIRHPQITLRAIVCIVPLMGVMAMMLLGLNRTWRSLRDYTLALLYCCPLLVSWIWIMPDSPVAWLARVVGYLEAFGVIAIAAGIFISRHKEPVIAEDQGRALTIDMYDWRVIIRYSIIITGLLACLAILLLSISEVQVLLRKTTLPFTQPMVIGMIVSYAALLLWCVFIAVNNRFDPLNTRMIHRGNYIYGAQVLGGLLALHIRVSMPWLFHGFVTQHWPLAVLGIAVAGITAGEMCVRRKLPVIGMPLIRTGMVLPIVPCAELFIHASRIHYSLVLLAVGAIYAVLATMKRSMIMGILAALSLNGSLWYLLHHTPGLGITEHPQLWIIPLAFAVLAAGFLNRRQLTDEQSRFIHYGCLLAIYLSSTMDVFLIGVANAPWLPLVLAGLSIIGIFIGLARHIRSYLFLGTGFLCLSLLTMIWHAASNLGWTWVWYVAGIALGVGIITVFALFEKKKNEMTKVIEEVKDWTS